MGPLYIYPALSVDNYPYVMADYIVAHSHASGGVLGDKTQYTSPHSIFPVVSSFIVLFLKEH